jgi:transposase
MELSTLLQQFDLFSEQLETIMAQVMQILANIPGAAQMLTVPGVGAITVAGFLAEVGGI